MNVYDVEVNGLTLRFQLSSEDVKRFKGAKKVDLELERIEREAEAKPAGKTGK